MRCFFYLSSSVLFQVREEALEFGCPRFSCFPCEGGRQGHRWPVQVRYHHYMHQFGSTKFEWCDVHTDGIILFLFQEFQSRLGSLWLRTYFTDQFSFSLSSGHSRRLWGSTSWRWFPWALLTEATRRCSRPYKVLQSPRCSGREFCYLHFLKCKLRRHHLSELVRASIIWSLDSSACHVYSFISTFALAINIRYLCYLWKDILSDKFALCSHAFCIWLRGDSQICELEPGRTLILGFIVLSF